MAVSYNLMGRGADPVDFLIENEGKASLAVITGTEGPSYRPVGAMMALGASGHRVGTLSSGCIEGDLLVHGMEALDEGMPRSLRYGRGSPFIDIQLPCGGGLDILIVPRPDVRALKELRDNRQARRVCVLDINRESGAMEVRDASTEEVDGVFRIRFTPEIRFLTFGKGPEATTFAALAQSIGYPGVLLSPDPETRELAEASGCQTRELYRPGFPEDLAPDPWTAVLAFFHDHEWEPPIIGPALESPAFYVGAQGSRRSAMARAFELEAMGVSSDNIARLHGPIGLIASARDARTLAVSVLAQVLDVAKAGAA